MGSTDIFACSQLAHIGTHFSFYNVVIVQTTTHSRDEDKCRSLCVLSLSPGVTRY